MLNIWAVPFAPSLGVHLFAAFAGGLTLERSLHLSLGGVGGKEICTHHYRALPGIQAVPAAGEQLSEGQEQLRKVRNTCVPLHWREREPQRWSGFFI